MFLMTWTEEHHRKSADAKRGKPLSEEHKAALRAAAKIRWERGITEENRENIRKARLGKKHSPETIAKIKESCKKRGETGWLDKVREAQAARRVGRRTDNHGYWMVWIPPDSPFASMRITKTGYGLEHRLVMAESLGRPLLRAEHVHHINEDRLDNRIENLQMMSQSDHMKLHWAEGGSRRRKKAET